MKAAFFDVDGTLTENRVWQGLMDYFTAHKLRRGTHFAFFIYHYFLYFLYKLKIIDQVAFRSPWARHLSWYFRGFDSTQAKQMWDWVVEERISQQWRWDVRQILQAHKQAGDAVFLVSGGPEGLLERIAQEVGADYVVGTQHEVMAGRYTGRAASEACQGDHKETFTLNKIKELGLEIDLQASSAYADSAGDIAILEMVGNPVAVYPDEELAPIAAARGYQVFEGK